MTTPYASIEEYAEHIRKETTRIMGAAAAGLPDRAGALAAILCTEAAGIVQGRKMREESSGADRYDLGALVVNASQASNSETGWEREE